MDHQSQQSFTELEGWQKARELKKEIETLTKTFPTEEKFRLIDQIIRSVRSINSNIAEAHGRFTYKEQIDFCIQPRGSLSETLNHWVDAFDCTSISKEQFQYFKNKTDEAGKLLNGYITYLRKNLQPTNQRINQSTGQPIN